MKHDNTYVLILAGGIGSRFWPLSRQHRPKQFLDILGSGKSLIQMAYHRYAKLVDPSRIFIITNEGHADLVKEHLPEISDQQLLREPIGKNTAACVAYGAYKVSELDPDATMVVAPSDHLILDENNFLEQMETGIKFASSRDSLVTLGIKPHRPDTGYGYIQFREDEVSPGVNKVITFTEKPPIELAEKFIESGDFLWNSGMFIWGVESILSALAEHMTEMNLVFEEGKGAYNTKVERNQIERIYSLIPAVSIDNGILEKADNVYVLPSDFGWSDLGTWKSVCENLNDQDGNKQLNALVHAIDSEKNLIVTDREKLVVIKDIEGLYIIDTEDALLICKNDQNQEIKKIASEVRKEFKNKYS